MTPDHNDQTPELDENGILGEAARTDAAGLAILGGAWTAQFTVSLPAGDEDDLADDIVDDGVPLDAIADAGFQPVGVVEDRHPDSAPRAAADEFEDTITAEVVADRDSDGSADTEEFSAATGEGLDRTIAEDVDIKYAEVADPDAAAGAADDSARGDAASEETGQERAGTSGDLNSIEPEDDTDSVTDAARRGWQDETVPDQPGKSLDGRSGASRAGGPEPSPRSAPVPATRREAHHTGELDRVHDVERSHAAPPEIALTSKRLDEFDSGGESSDLLTADRLLDPSRVGGPEPEGRWQHFVYSISGKRINLGDGKRARARKELDRRIAAPLSGGARFVPVLSRKGGVGKTTVTTLLGMALADARDDRVIAIDANPDRGTLAERIVRPNGRTVRDLVRMRGEVSGFNDISDIVARDETRLDIIASESDPRVSEAFSDRDYHDVASLAARYYSIVLTDTGTGIVHSVMSATLELSDQIVVVAGLSVDEARLASETLTWLEINGYAEQVRGAIVVLNTARPGAPLVRQDELEAHFRTRVRAVVRIPYDQLIATGSAITFRDLQPATREASRELAAKVVEGLRALASAA